MSERRQSASNGNEPIPCATSRSSPAARQDRILRDEPDIGLERFDEAIALIGSILVADDRAAAARVIAAQIEAGRPRARAMLDLFIQAIHANPRKARIGLELLGGSGETCEAI